MSSNIIKPSKGKLLLSAPFLTDIFKRSVVYITEYNDKGSIGFIINKPLTLKINDVIDDFPEFDAKVYYGGPVQQEMLNFFHKASDKISGGFELDEDLFWGGDFETLKNLAESGDLNPDDFRFFLGYAGWAPNQLDEELKINSWIVNNSKPDDVFSKDPENLWKNILKDMGGEYSIISTFPENPSVN
jgi:putative transcriptional regulator